MRWLAFLLLLANLLTWLGAGYLSPPERSVAPVSGGLPRVASLKPMDTPAVATEERPDESPPDRPEILCVSLGWFESREHAQALLERLPALSEPTSTIVASERVLPPLNWVLIPPQPREEALRQFRDIQRQGIDSYLVTQGEYRNAISLGLFESRDAAISVLEEKKRQNLNAVLVKYDRNQISYALNFEAERKRADTLVRAAQTEFGADFDFIEINPCKGVARAGKNP